MVTTHCTSCGHAIADAAPYCAQCGAPRPADPEVTSVLAQPQVGPPPAAAPPRPSSFDLRGWLLGSLQPATILVFAAAAGAFAFPSFVYAYSAYPPGNGARAVLALLLAVALLAAAAGTWAAMHFLREGREDGTAARVVFGIGVFATVMTGVGFLTALGR